MNAEEKNIEKKELRKKVREECARRTPEELSAASENIMMRFEQLPEFREARTVALYWSDDREVRTHGLIQKWASRKNILLPVVTGDSLVLKKFSGMEDMCPGCFGILEPKPHCEVYPEGKYREIDIIMVPGVGFDRAGRRLGRGKGYYDRLLPLLGALKVGVCFGFQLMDEIPVQPHDAIMDMVLSDKR